MDDLRRLGVFPVLVLRESRTFLHAAVPVPPEGVRGFGLGDEVVLRLEEMNGTGATEARVLAGDLLRLAAELPAGAIHDEDLPARCDRERGERRAEGLCRDTERRGERARALELPGDAEVVVDDPRAGLHDPFVEHHVGRRPETEVPESERVRPHVHSPGSDRQDVDRWHGINLGPSAGRRRRSTSGTRWRCRSGKQGTGRPRRPRRPAHNQGSRSSTRWSATAPPRSCPRPRES